MNPSWDSRSPVDQILVETPTGCLITVPRSPPAAVLPLCAVAEPLSRSLSSTRAVVFEGGSKVSVRLSVLPGAASIVAADGGCASPALPGRRRRTLVDPAEEPRPASADMICRFKMIVNIVESTGTSARPRPAVGELLKAVQCLKLPSGDLRRHHLKRRRRLSGPPEIPKEASGEQSSVSLLQETIAAIEQMHLSEPMEHAKEYAQVLTKLKELLWTEEVDDG